MIEIPLRFQEQLEACVPACLRMIFAAYGVERSEKEIYDCCQTDLAGTFPSEAANCARTLGFDAIPQRLTGIGELQELIENTSYQAIAYIYLSPILGLNILHAVIVTAVNNEAELIHIIDPAHAPIGYREWSLRLFELGWRMAGQQVILIKPAS